MARSLARCFRRNAPLAYRGLFMAVASLRYPGGLFLAIEIYGIKIRHRSRCLRPSVWPTPAADNRLPVRWTRAVDTNHTAPRAAAALKTDPEPLRFTLRNRRICTASDPYWRYALRRWGRAPGRKGGKTRNQFVSVSQIPWYYYSTFKWGFPGSKSWIRPCGGAGGSPTCILGASPPRSLPTADRGCTAAAGSRGRGGW